MERKFKITVEGRQYTVTVEEISEGESLIFPEPGSMTVAAPTAPTAAAPVKSAPVSAAGPGDEVSPLGGVVQAIVVAVGQVVKEGDEIAAIEAMKMVTRVYAHRSGSVARIAVKPGDAVEAGQVLLTIA